MMSEKYSEEQMRLQHILLESQSISDRIAAARNPNTPIEALVAVARNTPNENRLIVDAANATISFNISSRIFNGGELRVNLSILYDLQFQGLHATNNEVADLHMASYVNDERFITENILSVPRRFKDNTARSFTICASEGYESYYFQISVPKKYDTDLVREEASKMLEGKLEYKTDTEHVKFFVTNSYPDSDTFVIAAIDVSNERAVPIFRAVTFVGMKMYFKYEAP